MSPTEARTQWSTADDENTAVAELSYMVQGMAALLHAVPEARYLDPSGGYIVG